MQTYNTDVVGLWNRMNDFIYEAMKANGSGLSEVSQYTVARLESYFGAIRSYVGHVQTDPELDLPETSPRLYELEEVPVVPAIQNRSLADVCRMLELMRDELVNSQSSRRHSKLVIFDEQRLLLVLSKCDRFLEDYIKVVTPLDLPESMPKIAVTGPGRSGI